MLAEIFLIKMEAILRASEESTPADNSRFVPITLVDKEGLLDKATRPDPERLSPNLGDRRGSWRG
jgi:hypothetical protein